MSGWLEFVVVGIYGVTSLTWTLLLLEYNWDGVGGNKFLIAYVGPTQSSAM